MRHIDYESVTKKLKLLLNFINIFDHLTNKSYCKFIKKTILFNIFYLTTTLTSLIKDTKKNLKETNTTKKVFLLLITLILLIHKIHHFELISKLLYLENIILTPLNFLLYQDFYNNSDIQNILIAIFMMLFITNIVFSLCSTFAVYTPTMNTIELLVISIQTFIQSFKLYYKNNSNKKEFDTYETIELMPINKAKLDKNSIISHEENNQLIGKVTPTWP